MSPLSSAVLFAVLLLFSAFFSGAELALFSLSKLQVDRLCRKGRRNAELLARLKADPHRLLATILIGNNLVNVAAAALATAIAIDSFGNAGIGIATGVVTFLVLLFGEIVPKSVAVNHAASLALAFSPFLFVLKVLLTPVILVIDAMSSLFTRLVGEGPSDSVTEEEISYLAQVSEDEGHIKRQERKMIESVLEFDERNVDEIMTPRLDVFSLEMHSRVQEVIEKVLEKGFSRVPLYDESPDRIQGVLLIKDLLGVISQGQVDRMLQELMKEVLFVPENKKVDSLLREFQRRKAPFAIVVNEHGLFIGIVTIEDVLEELVGEIYDESDALEERVRRLDATSFLISGKVLTSELNEDYGFSLPESEDYDTLAGMLMRHLGRIPRVGDEVHVTDMVFRVDKIARHRILTVRAVQSQASVSS